MEMAAEDDRTDRTETPGISVLVSVAMSRSPQGMASRSLAFKQDCCEPSGNLTETLKCRARITNRNELIGMAWVIPDR